MSILNYICLCMYSMKILFAIGAGSFIGGVSRYLLSSLIEHKNFSSFPFGTLGVNMMGCLLIGIFYGYLEYGSISDEWKLFLTTGLLGGFTTFSAFSAETFLLVHYKQQGMALLYVSVTILLGLLATYVGYLLGKLV